MSMRQFAFDRSEGFVKRHGDFDALNDYLGDPTQRQVLVVVGPSGTGKSATLAKWTEILSESRPHGAIPIVTRFIGAGGRSTHLGMLLQFILLELKQVHRKLDAAIPEDPYRAKEVFASQLDAVSASGGVVIVIDGADQLSDGIGGMHWLQRRLPPNVKIVISVRQGTNAAKELCEFAELRPGTLIVPMRPFSDAADKKRLIECYLSEYIKRLDQSAQNDIVTMNGSDNPLFLKVVLSELRVFGAHWHLNARFSSNSGAARWGHSTRCWKG